ncbi:hypothetical protein Q7C36_000458 [Tachysurus vachellii]|uniref:Uncharacterized protein n=1 Tax=Tachysurus vachellii TaxID=175792 RepID=A0AA88P1F0_TACVA|nr:hypothetical protein Q7C36_000458 [Tachysurus vachellii]
MWAAVLMNHKTFGVINNNGVKTGGSRFKGFLERRVCRGELMFSSASRQNVALWHMNTTKTIKTELKTCAVRSRRTTSRTWRQISEETVRRRNLCRVHFTSTTKR